MESCGLSSLASLRIVPSSRTRLLRPFHPSERVAWASAEQEAAQAPAAAVAESTEDLEDFARAAQGLERLEVGDRG